ncbi:MAG TPA: M20/M25/M40 family metallo-hydrolase [Acidimicrobiales bacterium]|nr:M20/M25/M40 family metallo-hydrolase [Acidimicrobiales bacterium]
MGHCDDPSRVGDPGSGDSRQSGVSPDPPGSVSDSRKLELSAYLDRSKDRILTTLCRWLSIPSISADPAHAADLMASAEFCARLMSEAGFQKVEVLSAGEPAGPVGPGERGGPGGSRSSRSTGGPGCPTVYGEHLGAGPSALTVLIYGHHDVQPADPLEQWSSPPFEPTVVDDQVRARGASDDKGQVLMQIEATRGLLACHDRLPVNVKLLVEGEEEVGSPHLGALLARNRERFSADVVVVSDTTMLAPEVPSTTVSMRGLVAFDVTLRTAKSDLHSGIWGGTVPNAALLAARLAGSLHDSEGKVTLPGFYDRVRELTQEEAEFLAKVPFDARRYRDEAGVAYLEGEAGRSPLERTGARPTAEVVGIHAGYGGPGMKTVVPAVANLKLALRLVPDQRPDEVEEALRAWLRQRVPTGAELSVTRYGGVAALVTPFGHSAVKAVSRALERVWGREVIFTREGGSGPEEALGRLLGAPVIALGVGLPTDNFHAPNERLVLRQLWLGILAAGELLVELGSLKPSRAPA